MEFNKNVKVKIENLMGWDIGFHKYLPSGLGEDLSIVIKGEEINCELTLEDLMRQISLFENAAFCGIDGCGAHASLRIVEDNIRDIVFGLKYTNPKQLTKERIDSLLFIGKTKNINKLKNTMLDTIVTGSEARMILYKWEDYGFDKLPETKKAMLKEHCEYIVKKY